MKYCSWKEHKAVTGALRPIYQAPSAAAAGWGPRRLRNRVGGDHYRAIVDVWRSNWERFTPFLAFDDAIRRIIYTADAVESLNHQLPKVTKTRGYFPSDDAVFKILYLAIRNIGTTEEATSAPGPRDRSKHSTRSPLPSLEASTRQHEPTTSPETWQALRRRRRWQDPQGSPLAGTPPAAPPAFHPGPQLSSTWSNTGSRRPPCRRCMRLQRPRHDIFQHRRRRPPHHRPLPMSSVHTRGTENRIL